MSDTQLRRMGEIENYRQKAFALSLTDRLGRLITKTFDLIQTVVRDGPNAEILVYEVESLKVEHANTMKLDTNQDDIFRSLFYGLSSSLGSMVESIIETNEKTNEETLKIHDPSSDENGDSNEQLTVAEHVSVNGLSAREESFDQNFLTGTAKIEQMEYQNNFLSTEDDVKPFDIDDLESGTPIDAIDTNLAISITEDAVRKEKIANPMDKVNAVDSLEEEDKAKDSTSQPSRKRLRSSNAPTTPTIFGCNDCERKFGTPKALKKHLIAHKGFQCADCGSRLKTVANLLKHYEENHSGKPASVKTENEFKCTECDYKASCNYNLKVHQRFHTGEKPYACQQCTAKYFIGSHLSNHLRKVHGKQSWKCDDCGIAFGSLVSKTTHVKREHGGVTKS